MTGIVSVLLPVLLIIIIAIVPLRVTTDSSECIYRLLKRDKSQFIWDIQKFILFLLSLTHALIFGILVYFEKSYISNILFYWFYPVIILLPYFFILIIHSVYTLSFRIKLDKSSIDYRELKNKYVSLRSYILGTLFVISFFNFLVSSIAAFQDLTKP